MCERSAVLAVVVIGTDAVERSDRRLISDAVRIGFGGEFARFGGTLKVTVIVRCGDAETSDIFVR